MKIWNGYSSEHSMNLVMIGHFKEIREAEKAKEIIDQIYSQVIHESENGSETGLNGESRYTKEMSELFQKTNMYTIRPLELEQFLYDVRVEVEGKNVVVTTDESEISAFLKVLIEKGAKVEIYSAHDHPEVESEAEEAKGEEK